MIESAVIWIVERVRDEQYGASKRTVSWHKSSVEAQEQMTDLQAEFDRACALAWPGHEVVQTIFSMYEELHLGFCEPKEHEAALIEQLSDWWLQESRGWQIFVEAEIMAKMTDPPQHCQELVRPEAVHYEYYAVGQDPGVTRTRILRDTPLRNFGDG